ncbi:MAG: GspE/PulE family protein [Acidimicrobiia bacterium]
MQPVATLMALKRRPPTNGPSLGGFARLVPDPTGDTVTRPRLGDILVDNGWAERATVEHAVERAPTRRLGETLIADGLVDEITLARAVSEQSGIQVVDIREHPADPEATRMVSQYEAHALEVFPYGVVNGELQVAIADPFDPELHALLQKLPVPVVHLTLGVPSHVRARVNQTYRALSEVSTDIDAFNDSDVGTDAAATAQENAATAIVDDAPVIQVVNKIVTQALRDRASDVHIEPNNEDVRVRFRIDGALQEVLTLPIDMGPALVSRIKIMAEMNIVERRRPQDGQFEMAIDGRTLDVRVSTTSTIWGEKTVLRLLDRTRSLFRLSELGMSPVMSARYSRIVQSPFGMVIVSGPTGSGKTTTLYATLTEINRPDINVMTIEDPVEYVFPRVNQIQISEQAGLTFATGLKSILRQDPDVILVGEVRDVETARIAVQSALTGHLVLSSVHAIDSISATYRLLDMGVEAFLITSAIVGVVAQRLVRRICTSCVEEYDPLPQHIELYRNLGGAWKTRWVRGAGCTMCSGSGFYDRIGVYEVLTLTDEVREAIIEGRTPRVARQIAVHQGLRTLQAEAMDLVANDMTTIDEALRHVFVAEDTE